MTMMTNENNSKCCEGAHGQSLIKKNLLYSEKYITLYHFESEKSKSFATPILLVPSLIKDTKLFDVNYKKNIINLLLEQGFNVYSVDFGEMDKSNSHLRLGDYILNFLYRAIHMVKKHSNTKEISLLGYGIGGLLGVLYSSTPIDIKNDIKNLICILDNSETKLLNMFDKVFKPLEKEWFLSATKYGFIPSLYLNLLSFAIDFSLGFKNIPETIFKELYKMITENELLEGKVSLLDQMANLSNFKPATLFISDLKLNSFELFKNKISSSDIAFTSSKDINKTFIDWLRERNEKLT